MSRHVARVLERGVTFCRGLGELPRKKFKFKVAKPQHLMIFFNCHRNFGCPNLLLMTEMPDLLQAAFQQTVFNALNIWNTWVLHVVVLQCWMIWKSLKGLRQMRRVFLDKCLKAKCREKPWKVRARTNGTSPIGRHCALSTQTIRITRTLIRDNTHDLNDTIGHSFY